MTLLPSLWMRRALTACVLLAPVLTAFGADISQHLLLRDRAYFQDSPNALENHAWGGWQLVSHVKGTTSTSISSASLMRYPRASSTTLSSTDGQNWAPASQTRFTTATEFEARFPAGNYEFQTATLNEGLLSAPAPIPSGVTAPSAPMITNFAALGSIDASQPFTVRWSPWTAGTNNDVACVIIEDASATRVIYASDLFTNNPGGSANAFVIPARTLKPGTTYRLSVRLIKVHQPQPLVYSTGTVLAGTSTTVTAEIYTREAVAYAFGSRAYGALGEGTYNGWSNSFDQVATQVDKLYASANQLFLIKNDASLWASGSLVELLQTGAFNGYSSLKHISAQPGVVQITAGGSFMLFLKNDGSLWGVGSNFYGQLGTGSTSTIAIQTPLKIADGVAKIAAGSASSYFIKTDGTLWSIGRNHLGQLGIGSTVDQSSPVQIATNVASITAGSDHALFIRTDGDAFAMGNNANGRLGLGATTSQTSPILVASGMTAAAAGGAHSLLLRSDGIVWGTGPNSATGTGGASVTTWTQLNSLTGVTQIAVGISHSAFLLSDGSLYTTGLNTYGQIGDHTNSSRTAPRRFRSPASVALTRSPAAETAATPLSPQLPQSSTYRQPPQSPPALRSRSRHPRPASYPPPISG